MEALLLSEVIHHYCPSHCAGKPTLSEGTLSKSTTLYLSLGTVVHVKRELLMERIVILGSSGAGKSTLAKKLSSTLGMKVYHLDRLFWQRDWERKDRETRIDILQNLVQEKRWIIEGTYLNSSDLHLRMADTIIYSDIPPLICLLRLMKRHKRERRHYRRDIPEGCTDKLTLHQMVQTLPLSDRRMIEQKLHIYSYKQIIRLRSSNDIRELFSARADC